MAAVIITRRQADEDRLPHLCMRCGKTATVRSEKTFSKRQEWTASILLGGLPSLLFGMLFRDRFTVTVPLCDSHKSHFKWRSIVFWGGLLILIPALLGCFASIGNVADKVVENSFIGVGAFALAWVVIVVFSKLIGIDVAKIESHQAILMGVSDNFAKACERRKADAKSDEFDWAECR